VTINVGCGFLDAAREGDLTMGTGEVTRAGGPVIFVRGAAGVWRAQGVDVLWHT